MLCMSDHQRRIRKGELIDRCVKPDNAKKTYSQMLREILLVSGTSSWEEKLKARVSWHVHSCCRSAWMLSSSESNGFFLLTFHLVVKNENEVDGIFHFCKWMLCKSKLNCAIRCSTISYVTLKIPKILFIDYGAKGLNWVHNVIAPLKKDHEYIRMLKKLMCALGI